MNWHYFTLVELEENGLYKLVDEDGIDLCDKGYPIYFASHREAEDWLEEHNIRGNVK